MGNTRWPQLKFVEFVKMFEQTTEDDLCIISPQQREPYIFRRTGDLIEERQKARLQADAEDKQQLHKDISEVRIKTKPII